MQSHGNDGAREPRTGADGRPPSRRTLVASLAAVTATAAVIAAMAQIARARDERAAEAARAGYGRTDPPAAAASALPSATGGGGGGLLGGAGVPTGPAGPAPTSRADRDPAPAPDGTFPRTSPSRAPGPGATPRTPGGATVPDVRGLDLAEATDLAERAGLVVERTGADVGANAGGAPSGPVVAVSPEPGTRVAAGSTVTLTVAAAPPSGTLVPGVIGSAPADATAALAAAGFVMVKEPATGAGRYCTVRSQVPGPAAEAPRGSQVTVKVHCYEWPPG